MPWRCSERVRGQAFNDPDKQRKNLVSVEAVVVVVQVKKFGLQHSIGGGGANGEMANLTNEKGKFAIAIFRHFSPFFAIFRHG